MSSFKLGIASVVTATENVELESARQTCDSVIVSGPGDSGA